MLWLNKKKEKTEDNIRLAESFIQKAKECFHDIYDDYADIQRLIHNMETVRKEIEVTLTKFLNDKLV